MNETPKERATLDLGDVEEVTPAPPPVAPALVKETAAKVGFRETAIATPKVKKPSTTASAPRRLKRRRTARIHQFATRLSESTLNLIYEKAEREDITLAEVIERAMAALTQQEKTK